MTLTENKINHESHEDDYIYKENFSLWEKFLFFCAGSDQELLKKCPRYDQVKLMGIGGIVLSTAVLAFFVGSYAFSVVFRDQSIILVLIAGLLWSLVIFNLDRFIVSVSGNGDGTESIEKQEFRQALPRLVIAFFIGLTLAKPIEIRLMESEINLELSKQQQVIKDEYYQRELARHSVKEKELELRRAEIISDRKKLEDEIQEFQRRRDQADNIYELEISGAKGGTGVKGVGKAAAAKKEVLDRLNQELEAFRNESKPQLSKLEERLKEIDDQKAVLNEERDSLLVKAENVASQHDGLVMRMVLAHELYLFASLLISGLFIALEMCPVLFKLMIPNSTYDFLKENQKRLALARAKIEIAPYERSDSPSDSSTTLESATYYSAKKVNQETSERAEVELKLTKQAQEKFFQLVSADIDKDPSKYVDLNLQNDSKS